MIDHTNLSLLLVYKDNLTEDEESTFPLTTDSQTILNHFTILDSAYKTIKTKENLKVNRQLELFKPNPKQSKIKPINVNELPNDCFVWGWWKKKGEQHHTLLNYLQTCCEKKQTVQVFLLNSYLRRIYLAELVDIYYIPYSNTVEVPTEWAHRCPDYYAGKSHLCGCYIVLRLLEYEIKNKLPKIHFRNPDEIFKNYFIDELTFDEDYLKNHGVISPPEETIYSCKKLINQRPSLQSIKISDQTMFALRDLPQEEVALSVFKDENDDKVIADIFSKITPPIILKLLKIFDLSGWSKLAKLPLTRKIIGNKFYQNHYNIIKFDVFLVSWIMSQNDDLYGIFKDENDPKGFSICGKTLVAWVTANKTIEQRKYASTFFVEVWKILQDKWKLTNISKYLKMLPEFEEVAFSTKHGFQNKFYRDHLNHNIRAAMLSTFLLNKVEYQIESGYNEKFIAFLSGLLHDFAHPLSSYENTVASLQKALEALKITLINKVGSLVDRNKLKNSINIVALISSLPSIHNTDLLFPWANREFFLDKIDTGLLFDEMLCSMSDEHALLSAAVLFNCAVESSANHDFDTGLRILFQNPKDYKELFALIQCVALHDRKAAGQFIGHTEDQPNVPKPLDFSAFKIPCITCIADEVQEWGRPLAIFDKTIVKDADFDFDGNLISIYYFVEIDEKAIEKIPYSFLEHFFSKIRTLSQIKDSFSKQLNINMKIEIKRGLGVSYVHGLGARIDFNWSDNFQSVRWPNQASEPNRIVIQSNMGLLCFVSPKSNHNNGIVNNLIIIENDKKNQIRDLFEGITDSINLESLEIDNNLIKFELSNGYFIHVEFKEYYFCKLKDSTVINSLSTIDFNNPFAIMQINLKSIEKKPSKNSLKHIDKTMHLKPYPHFIDLDWRFSWKAINSILKFVTCTAKGQKVCYLGCPSLALYHNIICKNSDENWILLDKGHIGITNWIKEGLIPDDKYFSYDAKNPIPNHLLHSFDLVIMDPPWYKEYYELFWVRAISLIKPNGIIGLSEYPGYKKQPFKVSDFKKTRETVIQGVSGKDSFCSLEVSYSVPPFEKTTGIQAEFTHAAHKAYRPTYMDFYKILDPKATNEKYKTEEFSYEFSLEKVISFKTGHSLRHKKKIDYKLIQKNGVNLRFSKSLNRIEKNNNIIIAWSTKNCIVEYSKKPTEYKPKNKKELTKFIDDFEKKIT